MPKGFSDVPDLGKFIIRDIEKRQTVQDNVGKLQLGENASFVPLLTMSGDPPCAGRSQCHP